MARDREKKAGSWIGLVLVLLLTAPEVMIPVGICAGIVYLVIRAVKSKQASEAGNRKTSYTGQSKALDDCPKQLFCFHKDKGEHHVARGKEIDPWDRPDIDISKYQRKQ